jgi:hypothetical protein
MDKKGAIARHQHAIKFHENQIDYLKGKITWEEFEKRVDLFEEHIKKLGMIDVELQVLEYDFENGLISEKDFNIKKERINNQIIKICE